MWVTHSSIPFCHSSWHCEQTFYNQILLNFNKRQKLLNGKTLKWRHTQKRIFFYCWETFSCVLIAARSFHLALCIDSKVVFFLQCLARCWRTDSTRRRSRTSPCKRTWTWTKTICTTTINSTKSRRRFRQDRHPSCKADPTAGNRSLRRYRR